ncbi:DUF4230 domain-containing protein [Kitasatospora sp. NPDC058201]|uniref:DUF4230 domain-containing protein n=1 Tax=Streptomycetaceae TaxID=2062 RepID=UPI002E75AD03|nr:DUF4230 domain-containing protein [Streptomyces sp. BE303]MED7949720.1 DUF4230 domain-containing protein [Streptomyces sp. BE303]
MALLRRSRSAGSDSAGAPEQNPDDTPRRSPGDKAPPRRERRRTPWYVGLPVTLAAIVAFFLAGAHLGLFPSIPNPLERRTVDRSQPVLLRSIQDMKHFTGAQGNFQLVVDLDREAAFLPSALLGHRTLYVAAGTVDAYVDLAALEKGAVTVSGDRLSATVVVPHAQLAAPALDVGRSYVYLQQRGLFDRIGDFFSSNPGNQRQVEMLATQKIEQAAKDTELAQRAEQSTRSMLEGLLRSAGFTTVTVTTAP